jgi:beta-glucosidase
MKNSLQMIEKSIRKGVNVKGVFFWTLVDNFEWAEGFKPRFGLVYNKFLIQEIIFKKSAFRLQKFLKNCLNNHEKRLNDSCQLRGEDKKK